MAVTLFHKRKVINNITVINGEQEELEKAKEEKQNERKTLDYQINAKIRGKMYARRTVN